MILKMGKKMGELLATMSHQITVDPSKLESNPSPVVKKGPVGEQFEQKKYVYLSDVITREEANSLTDHMFALHEQSKTEKDEQCPLSDSIYGDPKLDALLERLCTPLSNMLGVPLLPTYTYARIYRPGEVLERHSDRPSCEISGTMTLGFDPSQKIWPIFFGKDDDDVAGLPLDIGVGDLVMYRGNELPHWRPKFKGTWQVQVFFHYVDANGPHKDYKYDGRQQLGTPKEKPIKSADNTKIIGRWNHNMIPIHLDDGICPGLSTFHSEFKPELTFTSEECEKIIGLADESYSQKASVGADGDGKVALKIRNVNKYTIEYEESTRWIFDKLAAAVATANADYYKYDIAGIVHGIELLHYDGSEQGHYDWHTDTGPGPSSTRKISISAQLTNPDKYEGGNLEVMDHGVERTAIKEVGSISLFPSYCLHRVSPVTKGERWVLVIWIHGSSRFK